ncbi:MAG: PEP-CTERM sorting domain-containing protein [Bryobacteraceae bacterium]|nr:PEP-CTERM sorting domain-containing protein [Bryobacteraceae bacterium]
MKKLTLALILATSTLSLVTVPLSAGTIAVWNFSGVCSDCPGNGTGVLSVNQDLPNGPLTFGFAYSSAWISYTMTNATATFEGQPVTNPSFNPGSGYLILSQANIAFTSFGGAGNPMPAGTITDSVFFARLGDGTWQTGANSSNSDFGVAQSSTFTQGSVPSGVPEPSSYALMGGGLAVLIGLRRRR